MGTALSAIGANLWNRRNLWFLLAGRSVKFVSSTGLAALLVAALPAEAQSPYVPPRDSWARKAPAEAGLNPALVDSAVAFAKASESPGPRDLEAAHFQSVFGREPMPEPLGAFRPRGDLTGIIVRHGYLVAEWGEPDRVDLTFSVTKSFLSTVAGLAFDRGLIRDVTERVADSVPGEHFASEHNAKITWEHLLRQTSDWQGTLWGKPDWADRPQGDLERWKARPRNEPGTVYTYNDVRVNALALASLMVWRRPLPQVLRENVMDPIGASNTWRWYGYDNSWIVLDGQLVQSMSGGAHWGGGMIISARDMARFGLLTLRKGKWGDRQVLSEEWIRLATTPGVNNGYGFMNYFLNTGRRAMPSAPEQSWQHRGAGNNIIYVDPVNDLVVVARWINSVRSLDGVIRQLLAGAQ